MHKITIAFLLSFAFIAMSAQDVMTPEKLLQLNKASGIGFTKDGNNLIYSITGYSLETNSKSKTTYLMPIGGGNVQAITDFSALIADKNISPDGNYKILTADVKLKNVTGLDFYPDATDSNIQIYDELNYRHWDTWEDGAYSHIMYQSTSEDDAEPIDIMAEEPYDCPQKPFGGSEDYVWSPDSKNILYVAK
ncbi:MAG: S9 family peptidase, partial [Lutibacter sp.]|nr:S9 family peptidase [Lutibacter sp.]